MTKSVRAEFIGSRIIRHQRGPDLSKSTRIPASGIDLTLNKDAPSQSSQMPNNFCRRDAQWDRQKSKTCNGQEEPGNNCYELLEELGFT